MLSVAIGVLVIAVVALLFRDSLLSLLPERSREPLPRSPNAPGQRVDIVKGSIRVDEFAGFLESWTGLTVVVDSDVASNSVVVAADLEDVDAEIVRTLLESNGCVVKRETLSGGREILRVSAAEQ